MNFFGSQNVSMLPPPYALANVASVALTNVASDVLTIMPIARNNIQECGE
jgi:hypothetical protein